MGNKQKTTTQITQGYNVPALDKAFLEFIKVLAQQDEIRLFVDGPPGMGHQASSVRILKALTSSSSSPTFGYEYAKRVEIYYQMRPDGEDTLQKLFLLLPELNGKKVGEVNGATVELIEYDAAHPPAKSIEFGFTGGADNYPDSDTSPDFTTTLNVRYFLRVQPYKWNEIQEIQVKDKDPIRFEKIEELGQKSFWDRAYFQPPPKCRRYYGRSTATLQTMIHVIELAF